MGSCYTCATPARPAHGSTITAQPCCRIHVDVREFGGCALRPDAWCPMPLPTARSYDAIAEIYDRHWGPVAVTDLFPILERLLLPRLTAGSRVLDVCCGTGQIARALTDRGYRVVGIDSSMAMLSRARKNAPAASFVAADARSFVLPLGFEAAISTFDSLNHMQTIEEMAAVVMCVARSLANDGWLLFDLFTHEGLKDRDGDSFGVADPDFVGLVRTRYDQEARRATIDITTFEHERGWTRTDVGLIQHTHRMGEVLAVLEEAGFGELHVLEGAGDLGMEQHAGRAFLLCRLA